MGVQPGQAAWVRHAVSWSVSVPHGPGSTGSVLSVAVLVSPALSGWSGLCAVFALDRALPGSGGDRRGVGRGERAEVGKGWG